MRLLLGGLILLGLFALASVWQRNWTRAVRAERDESMRAIAAAGSEAEFEWGKIVVGRPSGVDAIEPPAPALTPSSSATSKNGVAGTPPAPASAITPAAPAREFQLVIAKGQSLSKICKSYYGSGRKELVDAVARYNKLRDASSIREGQTLLLPPLESLGLKQP